MSKRESPKYSEASKKRWEGVTPEDRKAKMSEVSRKRWDPMDTRTKNRIGRALTAARIKKQKSK